VVGYFESLAIATNSTNITGTIKANGAPAKSHNPLLLNLRIANIVKAIQIVKNTKPRTTPPILPFRLSTASGPRKAATSERIKSGANFCFLGVNSSMSLRMLSDDYAYLSNPSSLDSSIATMSAISQTRSVTPAAIAGVMSSDEKSK